MSDKAGKESQFMFSHPELGSDPPIDRTGNQGVTMTFEQSKFIHLCKSFSCKLNFLLCRHVDE